MKTSEKPTGSRVPKIARYLNNVMAFVLIVLGIYHFTQPNAAWRSGTLESVTAISLLTAAYLVPPLAAIVINCCLAVIMTGLGIRHIAIGGGWVSGSIELLFAAAIVVSSIIIYKNKPH
jgi:hypothetical protein